MYAIRVDWSQSAFTKSWLSVICISLMSVYIFFTNNGLALATTQPWSKHVVNDGTSFPRRCLCNRTSMR